MKINNYVTKQGTELHLIDLKGKNYMPVQQRVLWFREDKPDWSIVTTPVELTDKHAVFRADIKNKDGIIVSCAHKKEDSKGFADFIEKAETGAIGRALANCGYGTQFATELLEADLERTNDKETKQKPIDAPIENPKIISFGSFKGRNIDDLTEEEASIIIEKIHSWASEKNVDLATDKSEAGKLYRLLVK